MRTATREAILLQRQLAVEEESIARRTIEDAGCEIIELAPAERDQFTRAVAALYAETRERFGQHVFTLVDES